MKDMAREQHTVTALGIAVVFLGLCAWEFYLATNALRNHGVDIPGIPAGWLSWYGPSIVLLAGAYLVNRRFKKSGFIFWIAAGAVSVVAPPAIMIAALSASTVYVLGHP